MGGRQQKRAGDKVRRHGFGAHLREELASYYRHAFPVRPARSVDLRFVNVMNPSNEDVDSARKSLI